jgi:hypothetical protein
MLDIAVPEIGLQRPRIHAIVGDLQPLVLTNRRRDKPADAVP